MLGVNQACEYDYTMTEKKEGTCCQAHMLPGSHEHAVQGESKHHTQAQILENNSTA